MSTSVEAHASARLFSGLMPAVATGVRHVYYAATFGDASVAFGGVAFDPPRPSP